MTIDTKLSNLNIWEGTLSQIEDAGIGDNDMAVATDVSFEDKFRYGVMPTASEDYLGIIAQYIGPTDANYTSGSFYRCVTNTFEVDDTTVPSGITVDIVNNAKLKDRAMNIAHQAGWYYHKTISRLQLWLKSNSNTYRLSGLYDDGTVCETGYTEGTYTNRSEITGIGITVTYDSRPTEDVYIDIDYTFEWELVLFDGATVSFQDILGNPKDNALLEAQLSQVTTLPTITADNKDRIYQYVGPTDESMGLYQGTFYRATGARYIFDAASSSQINDMTYTIVDENKFLTIIGNIFTSYPALGSASYLDIVFNGEDTPEHGYSTLWWIDPSVRSIAYCFWNETLSRNNGGIEFTGTPVIGSDISSTTTETTRFHFLISKDENTYDHWKWIPISLYPNAQDTIINTLQNKSQYTNSIIEVKSGDNNSTDGEYSTILGVDAHGSSKGKNTIIGYGAHSHANYGSNTAVGYNAYAGTGGAIAIGTGSSAGGMDTVAIGRSADASAMNSVAIGFGTYCGSSGSNVAIGISARSTGYHSISLGQGASSTNTSDIAIGYSAYSTNTYCIAIGASSVAGSASGHAYSIAIGRSAQATGNEAIALGDSTVASEQRSLAIGKLARSTAAGALQIGTGENSTASSLQINSYQLLNTSNGIIPYQRLSAVTPENGYVLSYDEDNSRLVWRNVTPEIPVTQLDNMGAATDAERTVQYVGESDGTYVEGYFYKETYDKDGDYWYWRRLDTQPEVLNVSYNDVSDKPSINGIELQGDLSHSDLGFAKVASTGSYADLTTKPGINGHPLLANTQASDLQIDYSDILNAPDPSSMLPTLPSDKDDYDYMLKWDHSLGRLTWIRAIDTHEDLGEL